VAACKKRGGVRARSAEKATSLMHVSLLSSPFSLSRSSSSSSMAGGLYSVRVIAVALLHKAEIENKDVCKNKCCQQRALLWCSHENSNVDYSAHSPLGRSRRTKKTAWFSARKKVVHFRSALHCQPRSRDVRCSPHAPRPFASSPYHVFDFGARFWRRGRKRAAPTARSFFGCVSGKSFRLN
jgi:hypothetical protein